MELLAMDAGVFWGNLAMINLMQVPHPYQTIIHRLVDRLIWRSMACGRETGRWVPPPKNTHLSMSLAVMPSNDDH